MDIEYKITSDAPEPNWVPYDELRGLKVYASYQGVDITHIRFVEAGLMRFALPMYVLTGSLAVLLAKDRHAAAAVAFIFIGFLPTARRMYRGFVINRLHAIAIRRADNFTPTLRVMANYFFRF